MITRRADADYDGARRRAMRLISGWIAAAFGLLAARRANAGEASSAPIDQPPGAEPRHFVGKAYEMQRIAVDSGDQAYGAVIVKNGRIVGQAPSRVVTEGDPTAHAEMEAIRDAARRLQTRNLQGCEMYATARACAMCETAAYWAGLARMYHGRSVVDAGPPRYGGC